MDAAAFVERSRAVHDIYDVRLYRLTVRTEVYRLLCAVTPDLGSDYVIGLSAQFELVDAMVADLISRNQHDMARALLNEARDDIRHHCGM
jgi:hypothetical protein